MYNQSRKSKVILAWFVIITFVLVNLACGSSAPEVRPPQGEPINQPEDSASQSLPAETLPPVGSVRSNPAPFGYEVIKDQMAFIVTELIRPADDIVAEGNMFNAEPEEGQEYVLVNISIRCEKSTDENCSIGYYEFQLVGSSGINHETAFVSGVPSSLESGEFFGGATKSGYLTFLVIEGETDLVLIYESLLGRAIYLAVEP